MVADVTGGMREVSEGWGGDAGWGAGEGGSEGAGEGAGEGGGAGWGGGPRLVWATVRAHRTRATAVKGSR